MSKNDRHLRGSTEQCPKCGCRTVIYLADLEAHGYGPGLATCSNCSCLWEPFNPEQIWDPSDPVCSFKEPCNNCAFRPGSPEQKDRDTWMKLRKHIKANGSFYCHKGVPIEEGAEHGFAYPDSGKNRNKLRVCRGYLNTLGKRITVGA